jgi:hypothetical protein
LKSIDLDHQMGRMKATETLLPKDLIARASLRGREYAWPISEIFKVIEAACSCIGGQLQFSFPDGPTCECYWVEVDSHKAIPEGATSSSDQVALSADPARAAQRSLRPENARLLSLPVVCRAKCAVHKTLKAESLLRGHAPPKTALKIPTMQG